MIIQIEVVYLSHEQMKVCLCKNKLNSEGSEYRIAMQASLPDGGTARDVYVKVNTMYENDKSLNEKAPDFSGKSPYDKRSVGLLVRKTVSKMASAKFLSARIGDSTQVVEPARDQTIIENESVLGGVDDQTISRSKKIKWLEMH